MVEAFHSGQMSEEQVLMLNQRSCGMKFKTRAHYMTALREQLEAMFFARYG